MLGYHKEIQSKLIKEFNTIYTEENKTRLFFAPGRVNLIGEHIDYNGGHALPCAINSGTYALISIREDNIIKLASSNFELKIECNLNNIEYNKEDDWANYPKGVIKEFQQKNHKIPGMNILFFGNIPNGAGLSSSASIEMVTAIALNILLETSYSILDLVKFSRSAENNFVGVSCGIMDQFAIGFGKKDCCIKINCDSLEYSYSPLELKNYSIVIMNSNKKRGLGDTEYSKRQGECQEALKLLQSEFKINYLCELKSKDLEKSKEIIKNDKLYRRVKHAVTENERVLKSVEYLKENNLVEFGKLLTESHTSLKNDFEVTGQALDSIVESALTNQCVLGARMTGAGFGGCAIALVETKELESFKEVTFKIYKEKTNLDADFYISSAGEGVGELI